MKINFMMFDSLNAIKDCRENKGLRCEFRSNEGNKGKNLYI